MEYILKKWLGSNQQPSFRQLHKYITRQLDHYGTDLIRVALAIVFIWFGALKAVGMSPAQELVAKTFYWFPADLFVPFLGFWEMAIGLGLLIRRFIPFTIMMLLIHMVGTFLPMFILTNVCYAQFPFCPSIEGQYIIKNLVLIAGALSVAGKYKLEEEGQKQG